MATSSAPSITLTAAESVALDNMQQQPKNAAILLQADLLMMKTCLAARGVTVYPSAVTYDPVLSYSLQVNTPEAFAWQYRGGNYPNLVADSPSPEMAKAVGYGAAVPVDPTMAAMDVAYGKLSRAEQLAVQKQIDGQDLDDNQVSDSAGSCKGQMITTLYNAPQKSLGLEQTQDPAVGAIIDGVGGNHPSFVTDPAMTKANAAWATCMAKAGVTNDPAAPAEDLAPPLTINRDTKSAPAADIVTAGKLATTDADCAQKAGIGNAYTEAVHDYLAEHIKGNAVAFAKYFTIHDAQVAAAKKYLGIN